jgi:hypothetical protein
MPSISAFGSSANLLFKVCGSSSALRLLVSHATVSALITVGLSFDDEPTANSKDELTVAASGSHNLRRRLNCNLCACSFPPWATRSPSRGRACPTHLGSAAMHTEGAVRRLTDPPTAKGLWDIGVQSGSAYLVRKVCGSSRRSHPSAARAHRDEIRSHSLRRVVGYNSSIPAFAGITR